MSQRPFHRRPGVLVESADGSLWVSRFYVPDFADEYYHQAQGLRDRGIYLSVDYLDDTDENTLERFRARRRASSAGSATG